ncbi:MAG: PIN domain-containing protein [Tepidisphaeraceae bacterium]|jgi:uncharacterized protein YacL
MVLQILRALFVLLMAAIGYYFLKEQIGIYQVPPWLMLMVTLTIGVLVVCIDILSPRRKLAIFSGTFLGLIVGMMTSYGFSFIVSLLVDRYMPDASNAQKIATTNYLNIVIAVVFTYLAISFILQTKDDFRFIIPYVEFSKQTKGSRPMLLDTSVLIDGRVADIAETGILESRLIVPRFVLSELQTIADSGDKLKRNRGRRGLDVLQRLQSNKRTEVIMYDSSARDAGPEDVDAKLMNLSAELSGRVLTNDFNLNKVASLRGVDVININDLANALKPVVLPGERMTVRLLKPGESPGQGVGYLVDGTMVVVEQGRPHLNEEIEFTVTSVLQTSAGKMIFGRLPHEAPAKVS